MLNDALFDGNYENRAGPRSWKEIESPVCGPTASAALQALLCLGTDTELQSREPL